MNRVVVLKNNSTQLKAKLDLTNAHAASINRKQSKNNTKLKYLLS